ncbi:MAG: YjgN family protein [Acidiferrobacterales bacterium]
MVVTAKALDTSAQAHGDISSVTTIPFKFTGKAGEYFKIWIVNIVLTILTLGIYSAWAKVRRKRYFYGNTQLQGSPFEYLAEPMQILKGRLIAFGIFVVYFISSELLPPLAAIFGLAFIVGLPWLVIRAHAFNARYSSYRNIRFGFKGGYGQALAVYIGLPILSVITLGLAYPAYTYYRSRFLVTHSGYGTTPFSFSATAGGFYGVYIKAMLIFLAGGVLFGALFWAFGVSTPSPGEPSLAGSAALVFFLALAWLMLLLMVRAYVETAIANLVWNNAESNGNRFESTLAVPHMIWLYFSNAVAIVVSLGLLIPWAQIRMTRYRFENLKLAAAGNLDSFVANEEEKVASAGEEIADFFDFDIGL